MAQSSEQKNTLLRQPSLSISDASFDSNSTFVASPSSPTSHRPGYRRVSSVFEVDHLQPASSKGHPSGDEGQGLGISNLASQERVSVTRLPVGSKESPSIPGSADPLLSPTSPVLGRQINRNGDSHHERAEDDGSANNAAPSPYLPFTVDSESQHLHKNFPSSSGKDRIFACKAAKPLANGRSNWLAITILILSIYSTVLSCIWFFIAIAKPRYGHTITTAGGMTPQTASVLCTAFAKSIELSFVTVFVTLLGQILSHRALGERKGITIAEMSMRSWVMQPGTLITHWESVRYAAVTYLGATALLAALMAMFYTTASDALVAPKLKFGKAEEHLMWGKVATSFANMYTITSQCSTPIPAKGPRSDPQHSGSTCIELEHSGEAYHNYMQYLNTWQDVIDMGTGSASLTERPNPVAMLYDNTTVKGSWINVQNNSMTQLSANYERIVNNVTMAMPHSGVFKAARDPRNGIVQPQDLSGLGEYYIQASVPSPVVNVLCAELSIADLTPMVYMKWPGWNGTVPNTTTWPQGFDLTLDPSLRKTNVDDLFGFDDVEVHPIFPKLPVAYNTIFNNSMGYGPQAVYLLATSATSTYTLCSIRTGLTPNCSTKYHSSGSGGSLNSTCEDPNDRFAYSKSDPDAPVGMWNGDWPSVATDWGMALSLNAGITDGNAANARLLTQLIPTKTSLDTSMPSISEALAVLAGNTLLLSSLDSPFIHHWNYSSTVNTLEDPQYQAFNASIQTATYQSGGTQRWQGIFYVVLLLVFAVNVCCLAYFLISGGLVTDFIEPQNLFCLSLLSPPNDVLEGTCASGPDKEHYRTKWNIKLDREREHLWLDGRSGNSAKRGLMHKYKRSNTSQQTDEYEMEGSPVARMYGKVRQKRTSML